MVITVLPAPDEGAAIISARALTRAPPGSGDGTRPSSRSRIATTAPMTTIAGAAIPALTRVVGDPLEPRDEDALTRQRGGGDDRRRRVGREAALR